MALYECKKLGVSTTAGFSDSGTYHVFYGGISCDSEITILLQVGRNPFIWETIDTLVIPSYSSDSNIAIKNCVVHLNGNGNLRLHYEDLYEQHDFYSFIKLQQVSKDY